MKRFVSTISVMALGISLMACSEREAAQSEEEAVTTVNAEVSETEAIFSAPEVVPLDRFTYANYNEVRVTHADLTFDIDFDTKVIDGFVVLDLNYLNADAQKLILDTNDLTIETVETRENGSWLDAEYVLGADDPVLGASLEIALTDKPQQVRIAYRTSPTAEGLQWMSPEQTAGKEHPFLMSQFQPIFARTMAPLQDTPAVRMTYSATVRTPPELVALMSASQDDGPRDGDYQFDMPQPVPAYLLAIAVGDLSFQAINDHIGVYAEDYILAASAAEFEDTPAMEDATTALYGPYRWGRYDLLVLPPSFPFGGMENPRLSFLTPTLVAGDKSLTNVVAHELAHSWSGNLVTNATWSDAWLNEGFTSYVENRVMEALYGEGRAVMERALDLESLRSTVAGASDPALTQLKLPEALAHPDDAFSSVAYVKGMFFLKFLEERFGRAAFDPFLESYFDHFAFKSILTEDFLAYFEDHLWADNPDAVTEAEIKEWVFQPGLPNTIETPISDAFVQVSAQQAQWLAGDVSLEDIDTAAWTTHEWLHFIHNLPSDLSAENFTALDAAFDLSNSQNAEIAFAWYMQAIAGGYEPARPMLETFLLNVGRGKFIYRLYEALIEADDRAWADDVYQRARPGYHPIAQRRIDDIFSG